MLPSHHTEQPHQCPLHPAWLRLVSETHGACSLWYILEDTNPVEASVVAGIVGPESTSQMEPAFSAAAVARLHAASQANSADKCHDKTDSEASYTKVSQSSSGPKYLTQHLIYTMRYL